MWIYCISSFKIIGIVVSPLCLKTNEWTGLSVGCNIFGVLRSLNKTHKRNFLKLHGESIIIDAISSFTKMVIGPYTKAATANVYVFPWMGPIISCAPSKAQLGDFSKP